MRVGGGPGGAGAGNGARRVRHRLCWVLVFMLEEGGGKHFRRGLDLYPGVRAILDEHGDDALGALMTNLAGHDMGSVLAAFHGVTDDQPTCFIAYTIKGYGLPFAGHKDNHAGLMNPEQMALLQERMAVPAGAEWDPFAGLDLPAQELADFLARVPPAPAHGPPHHAPRGARPARCPRPQPPDPPP